MQALHQKRFFFLKRSNRRGVALMLVLCFIVLLASIIVAFFSQAQAEQQISRSSANQAKTKLLADGAVETIIGDLKSEIAAGSTDVSITTGAVTTHIYAPKSRTGQTYAQNSGAYTTMLPATQGFTRTTGVDPLANLVKVSTDAPFYSGAAYTGTGPRRAAASPTTTGARPISLERWNKPLFLAGDTPGKPTPPKTFPTPNWIYTTQDGTNKTAPDEKVTGRYAYVIYDEGGLLDINVAGYPSTFSPTAALPDVAYKNALAYADLTQIGLSSAQIDTIVDWRNTASKSTPENFKKFAAFNQGGFLKTVNTSLSSSASDHMFAGRQQFIDFLKSKIGSDKATQDVLQYLTTFSRDLDQPSYIRLQSTNPGKITKTMDYNANAPKVLPQVNGGNNFAGANADDKANPSFLGVRVTHGFSRNDGSTASIGEPLVKKRFALNRLAWLTYKGPSAERNTSVTATTGADGDIGLLKQNGMTEEWLRQGTRENIRKYFGLTWDADSAGNPCWKYNVHNGPSGSATAGPIMMLEDIAALGTPHDPDFFELLKATINVGSLGKSLVPRDGSGSPIMPADIGGVKAEQPNNYNFLYEYSVDNQIIQIGANIISQFQTSNYPPRIAFDDGSSPPRTIVGVANLPYLSSVVTGILQMEAPNALPRNGKQAGYNGGPGSGNSQDSGYQAGRPEDNITIPGAGAVIQFPVVWNPHDPNSSVGAIGAGPTQFRVVADSATPDQAEAGSGHYNLLTYAGANGDSGANSPSGAKAYSYGADSSSPESSWYKGLRPQPLKADDSAIAFSNTVATSALPLFCEPAMLVTPQLITDSNGNKIRVGYDTLAQTHLKSVLPKSSYWANGLGLTSAYADNQGLHKSGTPYVGIYLGAFPLAWYWADKKDASKAPLSAARNGAFVARQNGSVSDPAGSCQSVYLTYRVQYKDPSGKWITYDTKYGKTFNDFVSFKVGLESGICGAGSVNGNSGTQAGSGGFWAFATDPRTSRFGLLWTGTYAQGATPGINSPFAGYVGYATFKPLPAYSRDRGGTTFLDTPGGWVDASNWISLTIRPDRVGGWYAMAGWPFSGGNGAAGPGATTGKIPNNDGKASGWMAFIASNVHNEPGGSGGSYPGLQPGVLAQNNTEAISYYRRYAADTAGGSGQLNTPQYFADPDGIVRRGMGAFVPLDPAWPAATSIGLPMAQVFPWAPGSAPNSVNTDSTIVSYNKSSATAQAASQAQSRPFFLHRPFRSVAELGYVFSDTPWRSLDFSTAESGGTALLDTFCINDASDPEGLIAGKVNLNTRQPAVLKAILTEAYLDPKLLGTSVNTARIDASATADGVAKALVARTSSLAASAGPLRNVSELVGRFLARTPIKDLGSILNGGNEGTLNSALGFYDGKLSYGGFSDGTWDSAARTPKVSNPATDIYSAYRASSKLTSVRDTVTNIQRFREAPIRALAAAGQTRVWNLMIDVVAQAGRFPQSAKAFEAFKVQGEQRYWVHVAIDRLTGKVIDKQIEVVKE